MCIPNLRCNQTLISCPLIMCTFYILVCVRWKLCKVFRLWFKYIHCSSSVANVFKNNNIILCTYIIIIRIHTRSVHARERYFKFCKMFALELPPLLCIIQPTYVHTEGKNIGSLNQCRNDKNNTSALPGRCFRDGRAI